MTSPPAHSWRDDEACICGYPGLTYDGPDEDCPTHGRDYVTDLGELDP